MTDKERKAMFAMLKEATTEPSEEWLEKQEAIKKKLRYKSLSYTWWRAKCRLDKRITPAPVTNNPKGPATIIQFPKR